MKFIVTTHTNCFVYDYDKDSCTDIAKGTEGQRWAYGVSWHEDKVFIAWRHPGEILEYDKNLKFTGRKCTLPKGIGLGDLHQISCYDGKIWAANTGCNTVTVFNAKTLEMEENWNLSQGLDADDKRYVHKDKSTSNYKHFNSISFIDNKIYVLAHMTVHNPPSKIWEFSYPDKKFIRKIAGGEQAHNIFKYQGQLTICDSANGRIYQPEIDKTVLKIDKIWMRGISYLEDMLVIGRSDVCKDRSERNEAHGGLIFLKPNGKFETRWVGKGPVEEIRCLDRIDHAHSVDKLL